jgi:hypothetical protein
MKSKNSITYYDLNDLEYSSYYLTGFYQNSELFDYEFSVSNTAPSFLFNPMMGGKWKDIFYICLFKARLSTEEFYFCIDTRDIYTANLETGEGYHLPLLKKVRYYFKVNYNIDAIKNDPNLQEFKNKIIPVLPCFPIKPPKLLPYLPRILPCSLIAWGMMDGLQRGRILSSLIPIKQLIQMRTIKKDLDIFFVLGFYNSEKHSTANEFRYSVMKEIQEHPEIKSLVGFISYEKTLPGKYRELQVKPYAYEQYLHILARARIGIYVRGLHQCFSFKFGQMLSLGMPIVGQTIYNNRKTIMSNEYFCEQFAYDDPKTIVQEAIKLLGNPEKQFRLGTSNANIFDAKFSPKAVVSDIFRYLNIDTCFRQS